MSLIAENNVFSCRTSLNQDILLSQHPFKYFPSVSSPACRIYCLIDNDEVCISAHFSDRLVLGPIIADKLPTFFLFLEYGLISVLLTDPLLLLDPSVVFLLVHVELPAICLPDSVHYHMRVDMIPVIVDADQYLVPLQKRIGLDDGLGHFCTLLR